MELTYYNERGIAIIALRGELDATHHADVQQVVERLVVEGQIHFVMDLTHVEFIDSAGLVMLIRCLKRIRSHAGDIYLASLQPEVRCVLKLTRLDQVFESFVDVTTAVQHFPQ